MGWDSPLCSAKFTFLVVLSAMSSSSPVGYPIVPLILRQRYLFLLVLYSLYSFLLPARRAPTWLHARGQLPAEKSLLDPGVEQTGQGAFTVLP